VEKQIRIRVDEEILEKLKELKGDKTWNDLFKQLLQLYDPENYYLMQINDLLTLLRQRMMEKGTNEGWRVLALASARRLVNTIVKEDKKEVLKASIELQRIVE